MHGAYVKNVFSYSCPWNCVCDHAFAILIVNCCWVFATKLGFPQTFENKRHKPLSFLKSLAWKRPCTSVLLRMSICYTSTYIQTLI